jgi:hypothetical protein
VSIILIPRDVSSFEVLFCSSAIYAKLQWIFITFHNSVKFEGGRWVVQF